MREKEREREREEQNGKVIKREGSLKVSEIKVRLTKGWSPNIIPINNFGSA